MKKKLILAILMVAVSISLLACSGVPGQLTVIGDSSAGEKVEIAAGGSLTIILESNPSTGFSWELTSISNEAVLKQDGEAEFLPPEGTTVGAAGKEVWTFKALKQGTSIISMEYSRPWEGGEKAAKTFDLTVVVK